MNRSCSRLKVIAGMAAFLLTACATFGHAQSVSSVVLAKIADHLSTKSAKVGAVIKAKTQKAIKLQNGVNLPQGSSLVGTVIAVQSKKAGDGTSSIAIKFDHVEVKGKTAVPIQGLIVAIGPDPTAYRGSGFDSTDVRSGLGSTPGFGNSAGRDDVDIPGGSSMTGVALGFSLDASGATELRGIQRDIELNPSVLIKVKLD